jgi:hypothetical protein
MHTHPFRKDAAATKAAGFASRFSYVSFRIHPESDPPHQCVYLAGLEDIGKRRAEVFKRDGNRCVLCASRINLQLRHGGNTKVSRCWCTENLSCRCSECHMVKEHGRFPRWTPVVTA